ncbi:SCO-spondin-like [Dreissena polymorpha]|uniref:SCO-spondin-like n=1 Tax=Dreissena polymorpha TaxID=45954 RepID=UPI002264FB84|nr:SCO-spondin-like [Dreissena polymorpha]
MCSGSEKTIQACRRERVENCSTLAGMMCKIKGGWSLWSGWSECSVTCEDGQRTRTRACNHPPPNYGGTPCPGDHVQYKPCTEKMCPIDGVWATWSQWSACDVTCENGTRFRTRKCTGPFHQGSDCHGKASEVEGCFPRMCPVDGVWNAWVAWSECSHTCGYGNRNRSRTCKGPFHDGAECPGSPHDAETCNAFSCPVDGSWKLWGTWGECSVTCGGGLRNRSRDCDRPEHGGENCAGPSEQAEDCNDFPCPIDCVFGEWSLWSACSVTCANGTQWREREAYGPYHGGKNCSGNLRDERVCVAASCPVDGMWNDWSAWDACNVTCGGGTMLRQRVCIGPYFDGEPCIGEKEHQDECNTHECPVDGQWAVWGTWELCNTTCGGGYQSRMRECNRGQFGGIDCVGDSESWQECNTFPCPVNGEWQPWNAWSSCNVTCGGGKVVRKRVCQQPLHGGEYCTGTHEDFMPCNEHNCPVDGVWQLWSDWTECTVTCGTGSQYRNRTCEGPYHSGENCSGAWDELRDCNTDMCPIDGIFGEWSQWSDCSHSCGRGSTFRNRTCFGPYNGGAECVGSIEESQFCNPSSCPVHGVWNVWAQWSACSSTCENGTRLRMRTCDGPFNGGDECEGAETEVNDCWERWCPVDGVWTDWTPWEECPVTCGGSLQNRSRDCLGPYYDGANCTGESAESQDCNTDPCPVDGSWSLWTKWSQCNVTCGGGSSGRTRFCAEGMFGGSNCTGPAKEFKVCNTFECPIDGFWDTWGIWTDCSLSCDTGERRRYRNCTGPFHGGADCVGAAGEEEPCNTHTCPVDGVWEMWATWSTCNVTCGGGTRLRSRDCLGPFDGGAECSGSNMSSEACNTHDCPIDGVWTDWSSWEVCSVTCGGGIQLRHRDCTGPFYGGANCIGNDSDTRECSSNNCPIDGVVSEWSEFYTCDVTCGGGIQWRNRTCIGPLYGGADCTDSLEQSSECNTHNCPVDGVFMNWSAWEACDVTCGGGTQWRNRTCDGPYYGGAACIGPEKENQTCNEFNCPVDGVWDPWSAWNECPFTCGGAAHSRFRVCFGPFYGGANCTGPNEESKDCNSNNCPVDGVFSDWSEWYSCAVTCGGGIQLRNRSCIGPLYGGAECSGDFGDTQKCNTQECPVDGFWLAWQPWQDCTTTCGGGKRSRIRTCDGPHFGGAKCPENPNDTEICGTDPCPIPGLWQEWSIWSLCTVTCGGGTRYRNRTCDMTSFGNLTAPCEGPTDELDNCHTYHCFPLAIHCADWASRGLNQSCTADVDPDGEQPLFGSVKVECDFDTEPGKAVTVIHHDQEDRTQVKGYEGAGEYQVTLNYETGWGAAIKIVDSSDECAQFMRWDCKAAIIHNPYDPDMLTTFWMNRTEQMANYFGGGSPGSGNCACGETNSCFSASLPCNCDENDDVWRYDEGFVTNKDELPIHSFYAGDTGGSSEDGFLTIGPTLCTGHA